MQAALLYALFFIYGAFGAPTPEYFGWAELTLAGLLIVLALPQLCALSSSDMPVLTFMGLIGFTGLLSAGIYGQSHMLILRDLIAMMFIFLPFWLGQALQAKGDIALRGALFIGLAFSIRFIAGLNPLDLISGSAFTSPHFSFLANSPLVLFAALYFIYSASKNYLYDFHLVRFFLCLSGAAIPALAMLLMQQRASLFVILVFGLLCIGRIMIAHPGKGFTAALALFSLSYLLWPVIQPIYEVFYAKTLLSGFNMRFEEWGAVTGHISGSVFSILAGQGWGAQFISPAVGPIPVNFTHNIFSMYLLKSGFIGLAVILTYLVHLVKTYYVSSLLFLTCFLPFLISITLYANFKSFGFGICLLLITHGVSKTKTAGKTAFSPIYQPHQTG